MILFFLKGLAIGFSIAAPVGPIGALCIRRTLAHGRAVGLASGMGAATADMVYGAIAAFGLTAVSGLLVAHRVWFGLVGGVLLLYLGGRTFVARPARQAAMPSPSGLAKAYGSTFALTLSNPVTILAFAAIFAGLGITAGRDHATAALLVVGVFLGSAGWWAVLSAGVGAFRGLVSEQGMRWVNRVAGAVIAAFGAAALANAAR
ncbi:MAG: LysE family transporter [Armatimonadota bacterium]